MACMFAKRNWMLVTIGALRVKVAIDLLTPTSVLESPRLSGIMSKLKQGAFV